MAAGLIRAESSRERESPRRNLPASYNLISKVTSQYFFLILLVRRKSLGRPHSRGRDYTRRHGQRGVSEVAYWSTTLSEKQTAFIYKPFRISKFILWICFPPILTGSTDRLISESSHTLPGFMLSPYTSPTTSWDIWIWQVSQALIVWEKLIQSLRFANKSTEAGTGKGRGLSEIPQEARGKAGALNLRCSQYAAHLNTPGSWLGNQCKPGTWTLRLPTFHQHTNEGNI